ncbi:hypothetical protein [Nitratireductor arenosus]|nr:hypothetical protein [Nitratireductor arenosus]
MAAIVADAKKIGVVNLDRRLFADNGKDPAGLAQSRPAGSRCGG